MKVRFSGGIWDGRIEDLLNDPLPFRLTVPDVPRRAIWRSDVRTAIRRPTSYRLIEGGRAGPYYQAQN